MAMTKRNQKTKSGLQSVNKTNKMEIAREINENPKSTHTSVKKTNPR